MKIRMANPGVFDVDEDLIVANFGNGDFVVLQRSIVGGESNAKLLRWNSHDFVLFVDS